MIRFILGIAVGVFLSVCWYEYDVSPKEIAHVIKVHSINAFEDIKTK